MGRGRIPEVLRDSMDRDLPPTVPRDVDVHPPRRGRAVTIIGPRRSGKTYLLYHLMSSMDEHVPTEQRLYVNLEDDRLMGMGAGDMDLFLRTFRELNPGAVDARTHLFLDEVQVMEGWERYVRRVLDTEDVRVYLTGSSSRLLAKEIATTMRGRTTTYTLLPFSFREFLRARGIEVRDPPSSKERSLVLSHLRDYIKHGGFPEVVSDQKDRDLDRPVQARELLLELAARHLVHCREGLVEQQDRRLPGQRPGQGDSLALTA